MNRNSLKYITRFLGIVVLLFTGAPHAWAQLTGLQSMYFENQYLANPAMAGLNKGLNLNLGYQQQWTSLPGSPKLEDFTIDFNPGNKVGLGLIVNSDISGLINDTRIMGTYAYHLPVSETAKLNFGLSAGINDTYIDYGRISGDQGDASVALFNQRKAYFDGDLGIAYTSKGFNAQVAIPNLGSTIFNTQNTNIDVDRATFYTAVSYLIPLSGQNDSFSVEPKVAYRGIKGFQNIADAGFNLVMNDYHLNLTGIYHSNQSVTAGVGIDLQPVRLLFSYTNNTGPLHSDANNTFEFGIKYSFLTK